MESIQILPWLKGNQKGYDIRIVDSAATVGDYHEGLSKYILEHVKDRYRAKTNDCEGCNICCQERIPLTYLDVINMREQIAPLSTISEFLNKYSYIVAEGKLVDISIARDHNDKCVFLRKEDQRCSIYDKRPLVCRSYICIPPSLRAKQLRSEIVNSGMDVLINHWLQEDNIYLHEAYDPQLIAEDWLENLWPANKYENLLVKDIISPELYEKLKV